MAIVRTVLPNTGLIQPAVGSSQYPNDIDTDLSILDSLVPLAGSLVKDLGLNGVASGFALSTSSSLTPGLASGVLYAQGSRYAPSAPAPGAAPPSATNYLFYGTSAGFYWQTSPVAANAGDVLIGSATTSGTAVTAVTQGTKLFGSISVAPGAGGDFTVPHLLGREPLAAIVVVTSADLIWWQATPWDATNLYLVASSASATAKVILL